MCKLILYIYKTQRSDYEICCKLRGVKFEKEHDCLRWKGRFFQ